MARRKASQEQPASKKLADQQPADQQVDARDEPVSYPTAVLSALAEPHRQQVLHLLAGQELSQGDLVAALGISQPLVSHHLKVLREAELIETAVQGRRRMYRLRAQTLATVGRRLTSMAERARTAPERTG